MIIILLLLLVIVIYQAITKRNQFKSAQATIKHLINDSLKLRDQVGELEQVLTTAREELSRTNSQILVLEKKMQEKERENKRLKTTIKENSERHALFEALQYEKEQLVSHNSTMIAEIAMLNHTIEQKTSMVEELQKTKDGAEAKYSEAQQKLSDSQDKINQLADTISDLQEELSRIEKKNADSISKGQLNKLKNEVRELKAILKSSIERLIENGLLPDVEKEAEDAEETTLSGELESLTRQIASLKKDAIQLNDNLRDKEQRIRELDEDNRNIREDYKALNQSYHKIKMNHDNNYGERQDEEDEDEEPSPQTENAIIEKTNYNAQNAHPRDKFLKFEEEGHVYTIGDKELKSVTTLVHEYFSPFDEDMAARRTANARNCSKEEVLRSWAHNTELGTKMHANIEKFYLGEEYENNDVFPMFLDFAKENTLIPYRTEWPIYDEEFGIAGTLDFLGFHDGKLTVYDWKRSRNVVHKTGKVKETRTKRAYAPISHIQDTKYYQYALQISIYRYLLEKNYGINAEQGRLVVMHPEIGRAFIVDVPYLKKEALAILDSFKQK